MGRFTCSEPLGCGHKSGDSQCEQSGLAVTGTTLARTKEQRPPVCCPMFFPKPSLCFQKYHIANSVSECASGALGTAGRQREPGITHNTGPWCMKNCFRFKNNQNEPKKSTKTNQPTNKPSADFQACFSEQKEGLLPCQTLFSCVAAHQLVASLFSYFDASLASPESQSSWSAG